MPVFTAFSDPGFVPGDSGINERDILERMTAEIGEKPAKATVATALETKKSSAAPESDRPQTISITLQGGEKAEGPVFLSQNSFAYTPDGGKDHVRISIERIVSIHFKDWKPAIVLSSNLRYHLPSRCVIVLRDGARLEGIPEMQEWLQLNLPNASYRTYFSDSSQNPSSTMVIDIEFKKDVSTAAK